MGDITPEKLENNTIAVNGNESPEKITFRNQKENVTTPKKETNKPESIIFKTPEKSTISPKCKKDFVSKITDENRTPQKITRVIDLEAEEKCDGEEGMISTTEQARLLIAASKTPSKSINKTPVKQSTPSGRRSVEGSPITPGKFRRVELITLASPKAKRLKEI